MGTFIYSPGVRIVVQTMGQGILDVTDDISKFRLELVENKPSELSFTLLNHRRKYDGVFTPNDVVHVSLKRVTWMPVFSGFLNKVPYFSTFPRNIDLTATCSLKRLKYRPWDPGTIASFGLLNTASRQNQVDGGLRDKVLALLTEVADWPAYKVHFGEIPNDWLSRFNPPTDFVGSEGAIAGGSLVTEGLVTIETATKGAGVLPTPSGPVSLMPATQSLSLTEEVASRAADQWYLGMRFPFLNVDGTASLNPQEVRRAKQWWDGRKMLVVNIATNKAVVLRGAHWGPSDLSQAAQVSQAALTALGAKAGDQLSFRFAPEGVPLGPYESAASGGSRRGRGQINNNESNNPQGAHTTDTDAGPSTVDTSSASTGEPWKGNNGLQPHAVAARKFVIANWNVRGVSNSAVKRNVAGTNTRSNHATGHAVDISISSAGTVASGKELALGNAIAMWFAANPGAFNIDGIIWMDRVNRGNGWKPYRHPSGSNNNTLQHRDHIHVDFKKETTTSLGPMGNGWPGSTPSAFGNQVATTNNGAAPDQGGVYTGVIEDGTMPMTNAWTWSPQVNDMSLTLGGERALMNDKYILDTIGKLTMASQRSFMSAPNGDFIAWFPDYFGRFGTAARMVIRDIEIADDGFTVDWDDSHLVTHQFVAGTKVAYAASDPSQGPGLAVTLDNMRLTRGIANVEMPELMESLFNSDPANPRHKLFSDPQAILQRFGARPNYEAINLIAGPETEFWFAVSLFIRNWAKQFMTTVNLTFLPELYPGMLAQLESLGVQVYITGVTHTGDFSERGGFTTTLSVTAPSTTKGGGGLYGLPLGGGIPLRPPLGAGPSAGGGGGADSLVRVL